ncbi:acid-sensing ion channel 1B isoform X3 [Tachysurus ichikawai]
MLGINCSLLCNDKQHIHKQERSSNFTQRYEIRDTHLVEESVLETLKVKADFMTFKPRPFNMREFYDRTGHDIKDMLLSCYYRGDKCSAEDFKVVSEHVSVYLLLSLCLGM